MTSRFHVVMGPMARRVYMSKLRQDSKQPKLLYRFLSKFCSNTKDQLPVGTYTQSEVAQQGRSLLHRVVVSDAEEDPHSRQHHHHHHHHQHIHPGHQPPHQQQQQAHQLHQPHIHCSAPAAQPQASPTDSQKKARPKRGLFKYV